MCLSLNTCVKPRRGVFSYQTTAVSRLCFLFLCKLFPSAGLTGSLLDNNAFLLPARASCFHCMQFSNQELPPNRPAFVVQRWDSPGSMETLPPFMRAKHRERLYMHVLMYQQSKVLIIFRRGPERHTHRHTPSSERDRWDFKHCPCSVCWRPSVSSCPAAWFFSVLHLCWSFLVQTRWSQPAPLPLHSCWSPLRKEHNRGKWPGGMQTRKFGNSDPSFFDDRLMTLPFCNKAHFSAWTYCNRLSITVNNVLQLTY